MILFHHVKQQCKQNSVIIELVWRRVSSNIYHSLYSFLFICLPLKHFITSLDCTCIISQKKSFVKPFCNFLILNKFFGNSPTNGSAISNNHTNRRNESVICCGCCFSSQAVIIADNFASSSSALNTELCRSAI